MTKILISVITMVSLSQISFAAHHPCQTLQGVLICEPAPICQELQGVEVCRHYEGNGCQILQGVPVCPTLHPGCKIFDGEELCPDDGCRFDNNGREICK